MAYRKGINVSRLKTILTRQDLPSWGPDYLPSTMATPQEAPSISRAFILTPAKLNGRETHLLSTPERNACLLGLYHPQVIGLQEQRMLSTDSQQHPLWTFPGIDRTDLPPLKGLIDVAERLGHLSILPRLKVASHDPIIPSRTVIFPYIGDLLWAVQPSKGNVYCVNWSIKDSFQDFKRSISSPNGKFASPKQTQSVLARHEIERTYYLDGDIRTIQVANEEIDHHVSANLRQLFLHHRQPLNLTLEQREEILQKFHTAFECGIPAAEVIMQFAERRRYSVYQCRSLFYQAIWNRELRVDLFQPILINLPLKHESRDVIDVYADWFRG